MSLRSSLSGAGHALMRGLLHLAYPPCCLVCVNRLDAARSWFCGACEGALFSDLLPACPRCARTVGPFAVLAGRCAACRNEDFHFDQAVRLGPYTGLRREVVLRLKQRASEGLAEALGERWGQQARDALLAEGVEEVVPIPLHWTRRWWRGYNQAAALAHGLAVALGQRSQPWGLRRVRHTLLQSSLSPEGRRANVSGAFHVRRPRRYAGKCVLLVDDVMTTGATCSEAARALKDAGAVRVVVAALARAGK